MCRTVHAVLQTVICGVQMLVRVFMTVILMIENIIRMLLQTIYNFISFMMQMLSLIPICIVFLLTSRLKCFMCGGGGPCPVNRGGTCDCLMSAMAIIILFLIFRATGVLDKIFYNLGYAKAYPIAHTKFVPTTGEITECSRNESDYYLDYITIDNYGAMDKKRKKTEEELEMDRIKHRYEMEQKQHSKMATRTNITIHSLDSSPSYSTPSFSYEEFQRKFENITMSNLPTRTLPQSTQTETETETEEAYYNYTTVIYYPEYVT